VLKKLKLFFLQQSKAVPLYVVIVVWDSEKTKVGKNAHKTEAFQVFRV